MGRQNAEIGMYPAGYSTMERIDSLFNYVFREVTSTATPTFQPSPPQPPTIIPRLFSIAVYPYESFSAPLWNLDSELVRDFSFSRLSRVQPRPDFVRMSFSLSLSLSWDKRGFRKIFFLNFGPIKVATLRFFVVYGIFIGRSCVF